VRFDFWMHLLNESLWPVTEWSETPADFNVDLRVAALGCLSAVVEEISPHRAHRTARDVDNSQERSFHIFANQHAWAFDHHGRREKVAAGGVLVLAEGEHETFAPRGFRGVIIKCPEHWMRTWLPDPDVLVGRGIAPDSRWGRVLAPMVRQLTPELAAAPPVPHGVLVDQLGAMLALAASEDLPRSSAALAGRIQDCIRQRFAEPQLVADDVATALDIPCSRLHAELAAVGRTFGAELLEVRGDAALRLLSSSSQGPPALVDVARRTGFSSASHLARVLRRRGGRAPADMRVPAH
jgi:AraC-like DNA-binding protein